MSNLVSNSIRKNKGSSCYKKVSRIFWLVARVCMVVARRLCFVVGNCSVVFFDNTKYNLCCSQKLYRSTSSGFYHFKGKVKAKIRVKQDGMKRHNNAQISHFRNVLGKEILNQLSKNLAPENVPMSVMCQNSKSN